MTTAQLDLNDVQGLIKRGYDHLPFSNLLLLQIVDPAKAKKWLATLLPKISKASIKDNELEINIAFSFQGFRAMGLLPLLQAPFSREFEEGMCEESRIRLLGDYDVQTKQSRVSEWDWTDGHGNNIVHLLLLVYGKTEHLVEDYCGALELCYSENGLSQLNKLVTIRIADRREHFGFRDGISQPFIKELSSDEGAKAAADQTNNTIALGEILLGYPNQYGLLTDIPTVKGKNKMEWEFGRNGTYLVMRQLKQEVKMFWEFMEQHSRNPDGSTNMEACIALAAKMVGRWPKGAPLSCAPHFDDPSFEEKKNFVFGFSKKENFGHCPMGAHIVRVNPRDALDEKEQTSFEVVNHHRLLRRGRSYGRPFITSMQPDELFEKAYQEKEERGLHFICLNANISRQFEFVQSTWINNGKFQGLYNDADPLSGTQVSDFTIQQHPLSRNIKDIPSFVNVKGGGYFFMPSHAALQFLAEEAFWEK